MFFRPRPQSPLQNVCPTFAMDNATSMNVTDTELSTKLLETDAILCKASDFEHLRFGKFRHAMRLAKVRSVYAAVFLVHIAHVVGMRSCEQMRRIAAHRIVTRVAGKHAVWKRPISQLVGNMTGAYCFIVRGSRYTVSSLIDVREPRPTLIRAFYINSFPETGIRGNRRLAVAAAKALRLSLHFAQSDICTFCEWGVLTASTFAQILRRQGNLVLARTVSVDVFTRLSLGNSALRMGIFRYLSTLTASALAISNRYFARHNVPPFRYLHYTARYESKQVAVN